MLRNCSRQRTDGVDSDNSMPFSGGRSHDMDDTPYDGGSSGSFKSC